MSENILEQLHVKLQPMGNFCSLAFPSCQCSPHTPFPMIGKRASHAMDKLLCPEEKGQQSQISF